MFSRKSFETKVKQLFVDARASAQNIQNLAKQHGLSSTFSQVGFTEAASYEHATYVLGMTEEFIDQELKGIDNETLKDMAQSNYSRLSDQLLNKISLKMNESDIQEINGLKVALKLYSDLLRGV